MIVLIIIAIVIVFFAVRSINKSADRRAERQTKIDIALGKYDDE